jgi:hypothetical protein
MAATADASAARGPQPLESNAYNIFMLVLTAGSTFSGRSRAWGSSGQPDCCESRA